MGILPHGVVDGERELSIAEKVAIIAGNLPTAADYRAFPVRAVLFTRQASGSAAEVPGQHAAFMAACKARGWSAGGSVGQIGDGFRAWDSVIGLVQRGRYEVVVVDTWDRLSATEAGKIQVLRLLRRAGVRLLIDDAGIDTGDPIGLALVDSLISAGAAVAR